MSSVAAGDLLTHESPMSIAPAASASPQASSASTSNTDRTKQQAALAKLLRTYQSDIQHGQSASKLKSLAKQITDAAKALGQNVTLPTAPTNSGGTAAASSTSGKVGVTA